MKVSVTLDEKSYDKTIKALDRFGRDAKKTIKDVVNATALAIETDAKRKLKEDGHISLHGGRLIASVHAEKTPYESRGQDSLNTDFGELEAIAGTNVVYAPHIEFGTKPHVIVPKNKKTLAFQIGGTWIFTKKVNHPGFKGSSFMRYAAEKQKQPFQRRMIAALNRLINAGPKT